VSKEYQIASKEDSGRLRQFLAEHTEVMVPMVELIQQGRLAVEELVGKLGRAALEAVLLVSAEEVVGPPHPGRAGGEVRRHGHQGGMVALGGQKIRVEKPRLRHREGGKGAEVPVPAYAAMQSDQGLREKLLSVLIRGVSTRDYEAVMPEMASRCGVSKATVSRRFVEASAESLRCLCERRFDEVELLVIYIDGQHHGGHQVISAVGVDAGGAKHVLGVSEGATENAVVAKGLLENLVQRGVNPDRRRLFVIDGSKALRKAIDDVYGKRNPVQRCRAHKLRNVVGHLPEELQGQVSALMRAAWKLDATDGMARLRTQAEWLDGSYPSAAASLREGMEETFTINRLGISPMLRKCLATTNLMESLFSGVAARTGRVTHWRSGEMVLRWAAAGALETEKNFRRIIGFRDLWMLKAALDDDQTSDEKAASVVDEERLAA
jgi:transposase-like protein